MDLEVCVQVLSKNFAVKFVQWTCHQNAMPPRGHFIGAGSNFIPPNPGLTKPSKTGKLVNAA